jgi:3-(3-hydroxy-phenyl)propionate hydroxylase
MPFPVETKGEKVIRNGGPAPYPSPPPAGGPASLSLIQDLITPQLGPVGDLPIRTQVVIVGAGPAGLTAANLLGHYGVETLVLEARPATSDQPKAVGVDDEYMRLLDYLGLRVPMAGHYTEPFGIWFMGVEGRPIIKVPGAVTPNGYGKRAAVMQPVFEKILLVGALRHDKVSVRYSQSVETLTLREDSVEIRVSGKSVRADYVLASDGAHSFVRKSLGIPFVGSHIDEPHLVIDFAEFPDQSPFSRFFCSPRRPFNSIPSAYGGRRIEFMLNPEDNRDDIVTDESIRRLVDEHTPYAGTPLKIIRRAVYGFAERVAARLQLGRVFLVGDAAHIMPPFGGQGMNTGARDANNIAWKLALVLRNRAPASLLDTYDLERRDQIETIVKYSVWVGKLANIRSVALARIRDFALIAAQSIPAIRRYFSEMRYMPRPTILEGVIARRGAIFTELIGRPFPFLILTFTAGPMSIDAFADCDFCLIGIGVDPSELMRATKHPIWDRPPKLLSLLSDSATKLSGVESPKIFAPPPLLDKLRGSICLLRPDRYVAAVATPAGILGALDDLEPDLAPPERQPRGEQHSLRGF